jgi:hypothetical protein
MKNYIIILFISHLCAGQNLNVYDSKTKAGIPYAIVFVDTSGYYTNHEGKLNLNKLAFDSIIISHLNYKKLSLKRKEIKDSTFLNSKINSLNEISIIDYNGFNSKLLKTPKKFMNVVMVKNSEIITCYCPKNSKYDEAIITELNFKLGNKKQHLDAEKIEDQQVVLKLNIYENKNQYPVKPLFSYASKTFWLKEIIENKYDFYFDISHNPIEIQKNGFCLGLEHLKFYDLKDKYKIKQLFFETFKDKSKTFNAKTYLYYPLRNNDSIISNNKFHESFFKQMNIDLKNPIFIPKMFIYY